MSLFCTYGYSKGVLGQSDSFHDFFAFQTKKKIERGKHSGLLQGALGFTFEDKVKSTF